MLEPGAGFSAQDGQAARMKPAMNRQEYEAIAVPLLARVGVKPNAKVIEDKIKLPVMGNVPVTGCPCCIYSRGQSSSTVHVVAAASRC